MINNRNHISEMGRSIVEMLGVLAIIGVLSIAGISAYSRASERNKINETINQIATVTRNIYTFYSNQHNYKGLGNRTAVQFNLVPTNMIVSHNRLISPLNGEVKLRAISEGAGFVLMYSYLPARACVDIASVRWGDSGTGLRFMKITSDSYNRLPRDFLRYLDNGEYEATELPLSPAQASSDCKCHGANCSVMLFFQ